MGEVWREFKAGDRVRIDGRKQLARVVEFESRDLFGVPATFVEYTRPHGYARIRYEGDPWCWLVHPEVLEKLINSAG